MVYCMVLCLCLVDLSAPPVVSMLSRVTSSCIITVSTVPPTYSYYLPLLLTTTLHVHHHSDEHDHSIRITASQHHSIMTPPSDDRHDIHISTHTAQHFRFSPPPVTYQKEPLSTHTSTYLPYHPSSLPHINTPTVHHCTAPGTGASHSI